MNVSFCVKPIIIIEHIYRRANEEVQPGFSTDDEMEECSTEWPPVISALVNDGVSTGINKRHGKFISIRCWLVLPFSGVLVILCLTWLHCIKSVYGYNFFILKCTFAFISWWAVFCLIWRYDFALLNLSIIYFLIDSPLPPEYTDEEGVRFTLEPTSPSHLFSVMGSYQCTWKPRNNHFNNFNDFKAKGWQEFMSHFLIFLTYLLVANKIPCAIQVGNDSFQSSDVRRHQRISPN